jgi:hypothetical protein
MTGLTGQADAKPMSSSRRFRPRMLAGQQLGGGPAGPSEAGP